jgi:hypothetical protein
MLDFGRDYFGSGRDIDLMGSLWDLQCLELASEEVWVHKVRLTFRQAAANQFLSSSFAVFAS